MIEQITVVIIEIVGFTGFFIGINKYLNTL